MDAPLRFRPRGGRAPVLGWRDTDQPTGAGALLPCGPGRRLALQLPARQHPADLDARPLVARFPAAAASPRTAASLHRAITMSTIPSSTTTAPATVHAPHRPLTDYYANEQERQGFVRAIFDRTAPDYDRVERLLALGSGPR